MFAELMVIVLLLVMTYFVWSARRALVHICAQLSLLCKFTEEIKCHMTGTDQNPDDDINKILGLAVPQGHSGLGVAQDDREKPK